MPMNSQLLPSSFSDVPLTNTTSNITSPDAAESSRLERLCHRCLSPQMQTASFRLRRLASVLRMSTRRRPTSSNGLFKRASQSQLRQSYWSPPPQATCTALRRQPEICGSFTDSSCGCVRMNSQPTVSMTTSSADLSLPGVTCAQKGTFYDTM